MYCIMGCPQGRSPLLLHFWDVYLVYVQPYLYSARRVRNLAAIHETPRLSPQGPEPPPRWLHENFKNAPLKLRAFFQFERCLALAEYDWDFTISLFLRWKFAPVATVWIKKSPESPKSRLGEVGEREPGTSRGWGGPKEGERIFAI